MIEVIRSDSYRCPCMMSEWLRNQGTTKHPVVVSTPLGLISLTHHLGTRSLRIHC